MITSYFHIQIILILISITLGHIVWTYNSKSYLNRILTLIIICVILIEISLLLYLRGEGKRLLIETVILGSVGISFFAPLLFSLSLYYPIKKEFNKNALKIIYLISVVLSVLIVITFPKDFSLYKITLPVSIKEISLRNFPVIFVVLYFFLTSYSILLLILSTRNLLFSFKGNIIPCEKHTVRLLIIVGMPLAYLLSVVSVINFFFYIPFPWVSFILAVFILFTVILVFRFHLIDLRRLLSGIIFYPSLIAVIVFIYISIILKNQDKIANIFSLPQSITLVMEVFIIYLVVSTLRRIFELPKLNIKFPYVNIFEKIGSESFEHLSYAITIEELYKRLQEIFKRYGKIEKVLLLLCDREEHLFVNIGKEYNFSIDKNSELIEVLSKIKRGITLEELLLYLNKREDIKSLYEHGINLILPIEKGNEVIALILLPKRSLLRRWSYEEISSLNYLRAIMPSLIDRCIMYENEKEIEKNQYRMEQLAVIGQMSSDLAHEIRNPLSIISASVETILNGDIEEKDKEKMLIYIQEETDRINILANKLLSVNFQKTPEFERVELSSVIKKLTSFLNYKIKDKNIIISILNDKPLYFYSDPNILFQIFLNLALNSIEAIKNSGIMSIDYYNDQRYLTIIFKDNGPGIPVKLKDKIFEPFFTTKKSGTGLGLTVTKKLVENLYGNLVLVPSGVGAIFNIIIPILKIEE